jgi:hypothetical protein
MKIENNFFRSILVIIVFAFVGCETIDLDQTENPSQISPDLLDPVFAFNYIQLQLPDFVDSANSFTQRVTRQMAMTGGNTYNNAFEPASFNNNWFLGYNLLNTVKTLEPKAIANREFYVLGASKVIRVYVLLTMVDMYGNIPYSEALQGNLNLTPKFDNSADIYKGLLLELDDAIATLENPSDNPNSIKQDLYYSSKEGWIKLANTLKLKMYCTARLAGSEIGVDAIDIAIKNIVNENNFIDEISEDFAFKYGNSRNTPNTRHPMYNDQYELGGGAYISNYFMWAMTSEKNFGTKYAILTTPVATTDPRIHFYFFKQTENPQNADTFELPRPTRPDHYNDQKYRSFYFAGNASNPARTPSIVSNFTNQASGLIPADGFWGRDHGDNSGIPPDALFRTVGGMYPIGGEYATPASVQTSGQAGAQGAGIMPMILSSYVHFLLAEASLAYPSIGLDPESELEKGIRQSISKTVNFIPNFIYKNVADKPNPAAMLESENDYVNYVKAKYNDAGTNQMELIVKEYYLAAWGNGIEPYNNYRRTGYPSNFQPTLELDSGVYYSTALYPANGVVNNPNAPDNVRTKKVFWDKAAITLH